MGTTVSSLQFLSTAEDAMPRAVVVKWSDRFLTVCPGELYLGQLDRQAGWLSKKLDCTVLSVSMFDKDGCWEKPMYSAPVWDCHRRLYRS